MRLSKVIESYSSSLQARFFLWRCSFFLALTVSMLQVDLTVPCDALPADSPSSSLHHPTLDRQTSSFSSTSFVPSEDFFSLFNRTAGGPLSSFLPPKRPRGLFPLQLPYPSNKVIGRFLPFPARLFPPPS